MKVFLLLVLALATVALSQPVENLDDEWHNFKITYEKEYEDEEEETLRKKVFMDNHKFVQEHNAKYQNGEVTYKVGINKFADLTAKEFASMMNGFRVPEGYERSGKEFNITQDLELPTTVDWRKKGAVTGVKSQGDCGSCWAFSATGSLEGQTYLKKGHKLISLSEQNLIDCSQAEGNGGCGGGNMDYAFVYVYNNKGIDTEKSYPYEGEDDKCRYNPNNKGAEVTGLVDIPSGSEQDLQQAVAQVGPISVAIDANHDSFGLYASGVYNEPACSSYDLGHAVLAVGYGTAKKGGDYWLVKNSWGTDWGMKGYIMMSRNKNNQCGIATAASYPTV